MGTFLTCSTSMNAHHSLMRDMLSESQQVVPDHAGLLPAMGELKAPGAMLPRRKPLAILHLAVRADLKAQEAVWRRRLLLAKAHPVARMLHLRKSQLVPRIQFRDGW